MLLARPHLQNVSDSLFELMDCVEAQLFWMLSFAKEYRVSPERLDGLYHLITRTRTILQELQLAENGLAIRNPVISDEKYHNDSSDDKVPMPYEQGG